MNLAWLRESLHHDHEHQHLQSKSSLASRTRKRYLHRSSGSSWSADPPHRQLTNSSSSSSPTSGMNFLLHRNRTSPASVSSSSSSSSSSLSTSSNHSMPNTSFMRKAHVLGDLVRHSTKVYSLTTVAVIAGIFVMVTVATAAIVALFWCKRNSVFAFKAGEADEADECEMDEFDTDVEDAEELLCRTSATEDDEDEEEEEDDDEDEEEDDEEEEEEDEERKDAEDPAADAAGLSSLSILSRSESMAKTSTCFPRAARTRVALRDRKSIFRGLKNFRFRSADLVASADRLLQPSSLVGLLDHRRGGQTSPTTDHSWTQQQQHSSSSGEPPVEFPSESPGEPVVYSCTTDDMTSQLVQDGGDVSNDDDEEGTSDEYDYEEEDSHAGIHATAANASSHFRCPPASSQPRRPRFAGYRRLVVMATVEDETAAAVVGVPGARHPLQGGAAAVIFQTLKDSRLHHPL